MVAYVYNDYVTVTTETAAAAEKQEYCNNWPLILKIANGNILIHVSWRKWELITTC
jgi:hypothetical protein